MAKKVQGAQPEPLSVPVGREIVSRLISDLTYDPENARKHGDSDIAAICKSLSCYNCQCHINNETKSTPMLLGIFCNFLLHWCDRLQHGARVYLNENLQKLLCPEGFE